MERQDVIEIIRELAKNNNCRYAKPDSDVLDMLIQFANLVKEKVKDEQ